MAGSIYRHNTILIKDITKMFTSSQIRCSRCGDSISHKIKDCIIKEDDKGHVISTLCQQCRKELIWDIFLKEDDNERIRTINSRIIIKDSK